MQTARVTRGGFAKEVRRSRRADSLWRVGKTESGVLICIVICSHICSHVSLLTQLSLGIT